MIVSLAATLFLTSMQSITHEPFGKTSGGETVEVYTLKNSSGASVKVLDYGGIVTEINVPDAQGKLSNVTLGFDNMPDYETKSPYFGCLVGRFANRIAKGRFTLDGKEYTLAVNNGPNALHGGLKGYDKRIWKAKPLESSEGPALQLTLHDPDGTEGYPGTLDTTVTYTWTNDNVLEISYVAKVDGKATPLNLTNHAYFNLKDAGKSDILGHVLTLDCDQYTPVDDTSIPTGTIAPVEGTAIDFRSPKTIGKDMAAMGSTPPGYDHNLVVRGSKGTLRRAARVEEPTTGRTMECWTTEPGVQLYTGNFLDANANEFAQHHGFCLETQHYPDSINQPSFPSVVLRPGETYRSTTEYRFGVKK
jgi:aldose 1-epimerase